MIKLIKNNVTLNKPSSYNHFSGQISCQNLDIIRTIANPTFQFIFSDRTQNPAKIICLTYLLTRWFIFVSKMQLRIIRDIFSAQVWFFQKSDFVIKICPNRPRDKNAQTPKPKISPNPLILGKMINYLKILIINKVIVWKGLLFMNCYDDYGLKWHFYDFEKLRKKNIENRNSEMGRFSSWSGREISRHDSKSSRTYSNI